MDGEQCSEKSQDGGRRWWQFRTQLERKLLIIVIAMSLTLFTIMTYAFFLHITSVNTAPVCMSVDCVQTAAKFLSSIDSEADPCEDFARFACGNFLASSNPNTTASELVESEIAARRKFERVFTTTESKSVKKICVANLRYLYNTCMNRSIIDGGVENLKRELIGPLGGWPLINNNWDEAFTGHSGALNFNWIWANFLSKLHTMGFRSDIFFSLKLYGNFTDRKNYLMVTPPILGEAAISKKFRKENEAFLYRTLEAFGGDKIRAAYDINYLGDFTLELIKIMSKYSNTSQNKPPSEPKLITLLEVETLTQSSQINWSQLLTTLTNKIPIFTTNDFIIFDVNMREYMRELQGLLQKTPRRVLVNYIIWEVLKDMQLWYNVPNSPLSPQITLHERNHLCIDEVNKIMPLIANQILAENNPYREDIKKIIIKIRDEVISRINNIKWVDDKMKIFLEQKLRNIKFFIGGKLDGTNFTIDYRQNDLTDLTKNKNYIQAISTVKLSVDNYHYDVLFNKTTLETTIIRLLNMDASANAFYLTNNYIGIPTGLIHQLYSNTLPNYVNYARLGHLIGHELSHVFSLFAQKYGLEGEPNPLWSEDLIDNYTQHHKCLAEEYEEYSLEKYRVELNGTITLDENMADLIGTHSAYEVFRLLEPSDSKESVQLPAVKDYSARQLFWISFARYYCDPQEATHILIPHLTPDVHGTASFRIFSTLKKSQRFAVDFKCKKGSRMNPLRKCNF